MVNRYNQLVPLHPNARPGNDNALRYDPAYCQTVRDLAQQGKFPESWGAELGVSTRTINHWANTYPEFEEAVIIAWHILANVHEAKLAALIAAGSPTARVQFRLMEVRFRSAWGPNSMATLEGFMARNDPDPSAAKPIGARTSAEIKAEIEALRARRDHEKVKR